MCGIAGVINYTEQDLRETLLTDLWTSLNTRGPDSRGFLSFKNGRVVRGAEAPLFDCSSKLLMLHTRLSIIDLSEGGWQPMSSKDGRYHIVFNGEIFNFKELRSELVALGVEFTSESDTEVLLNGYIHWKKEILTKSIGMFAFAIFDAHSETLLLARDPFGIKPLFYTQNSDCFSFASCLNTLLKVPGVRNNVEASRAFLYLRFGLTDYGEKCLIEGIKQIPPAHYLEMSLSKGGNSRVERYWNVERNNEIDISFPQAVERFRDLFIESVRLHLRSDVPLGLALSGGVDSSSLLAVAKEFGGQIDELSAFSYIAESSQSSEEKWMNIIASRLNVPIHKTMPSCSTLSEEFDRILLAHGEPFGSSTVFAQWSVCKLVKEKRVKVLLEGQGADELLAGYPQYRAARLASLLKQGKIYDAIAFLRGCGRFPEGVIYFVVAKACEYLLPRGMRDIGYTLLRKPVVPKWLNDRWLSDRNAVLFPKSEVYGKNVLKDVLHDTLSELCLPHLLRKGDRNAMAFSIENRVPYLTPDLVKFTYSLPEKYLVSRVGDTKHLLREAMKGIVPAEILARKDKIGFAAPEKEWLKNSSAIVDRSMNSQVIHDSGMFNTSVMRRSIERERTNKSEVSPELWRIVSFVRWAELFDIQLN